MQKHISRNILNLKHEHARNRLYLDLLENFSRYDIPNYDKIFVLRMIYHKLEEEIDAV